VNNDSNAMTGSAAPASAASREPLRIGAAGLGRAFVLMLPTFAHPRVRLAAVADPRPEARARFVADYGGAAYESFDALCRDPDIDAVYISSPHRYHAEQVVTAAQHGKHVLCEKPIALTLGECARMIDAAERAGVQLLVGHSHSYDAPFAQARRLIASGAVGAVRMITALNFTDFMYRPRRPEELVTAAGGGVVYSQAAHQVDVVRLLAGGKATSIRAHAGAWDRSRPSEGAYSALLAFAGGAFASLTYSGYAHYDSDELTEWIGELGHAKDPARYGAARAVLRKGLSPAEETALKMTRTYGGSAASSNPNAGAADAAPVGHNQFGMVIASCERADLRPLPSGLMIYDDTRAWLDPLPPPAVPRAEVFDELCDAIAGIRAPIHTGRWAMATLEVCLAILESAKAGREIALSHQVPLGD
jgi:phthalate 4,5-cis-dihydrodiol dehydrogenase